VKALDIVMFKNAKTIFTSCGFQNDAARDEMLQLVQ